MVVASERLHQDGEVAPIELVDEMPVTLQKDHRLTKGVLRLVEASKSSFEVVPPNDLYGNPIRETAVIDWNDTWGPDRTVKIYH